MHGVAAAGMQRAGSWGVGSGHSSWASMHAQGCRNSTCGDIQGNALRAMWDGAASYVADSAAAHRAMCKSIMDLVNLEHDALLRHPAAAL